MKHQELHPRTAIINKKQKMAAKSLRNDALTWLASTFPNAFDATLRIRPLQLGVMSEILAHADKAALEGISKSKLREAVVVFTRRIDYLTCLKAREERIDLEGNPVGPVTEAEANHAAEKIRKRVEKTAKNARKNSSVSTHNHSSQKSVDKLSEEKESHSYPERYPAFGSRAHNEPQFTRIAPPVQVKHKSSRAYDPAAVARLKEKLGLSRRNEATTEKTD